MTCLDIVMILLIMADQRSKQVAGLEELFKASDWIFNFALAISIKKLVMTNLDLTKSKRGFLGSKGKFQYFIIYSDIKQLTSSSREDNPGCEFTCVWMCPSGLHRGPLRGAYGTLQHPHRVPARAALRQAVQ